jgi:hypothetical protein
VYTTLPLSCHLELQPLFLTNASGPPDRSSALLDDRDKVSELIYTLQESSSCHPRQEETPCLRSMSN